VITQHLLRIAVGVNHASTRACQEAVLQRPGLSSLSSRAVRNRVRARFAGS
jgi:hypothetical protein